MPVQGTVKTMSLGAGDGTVLKSSPAPRVNDFDFPEQA